jgi:RNA polymerase sigma factor (sigma-70 family)
LDARPGNRRLRRLDDERLAALVRRGDAAAFEALYDRHHGSLLAFCRHMVGNREDGEDALQQTFLRAHQALMTGRLPDSVRPWLFAIARNRCRTLLATRRPAALPADEVEVAFDGLADDVRRRSDLRELVADLARLPEDQRGALVLHELGDLSHVEIATVLGCAPEKVKALVFQARTALIAEREARAMPCEEIRGQLELARGGALRRGPLRRHLRQCEPCSSYRLAVARQRASIAVILPVVPSAGLKAAVLGGSGAAAATSAGVGGAAGVSAGTGGAAASGVGGAAGTSAGVGAAAASSVGGGAVAASTVAVKALAAKVAIGAVVAGAGVTGGAAAIDGPAERVPVRVAAPTVDARPSPAGRAPAPPGESAPATGTTTEVVARRTRSAGRVRSVVRHRRFARRHRRFVRRRIVRRHRRFLRRALIERRAAAGGDPVTLTGDALAERRAARRRAREVETSSGTEDPPAERRRRRRGGDREPGADETEPAAEGTEPATPDPPIRRRRRPTPAPTPEPTPSPETEPEPTPTPEPTPSPTPEATPTPSPEPPAADDPS